MSFLFLLASPSHLDFKREMILMTREMILMTAWTCFWWYTKSDVDDTFIPSEWVLLAYWNSHVLSIHIWISELFELQERNDSDDSRSDSDDTKSDFDDTNSNVDDTLTQILMTLYIDMLMTPVQWYLLAKWHSHALCFDICISRRFEVEETIWSWRNDLKLKKRFEVDKWCWWHLYNL